MNGATASQLEQLGRLHEVFQPLLDSLDSAGEESLADAVQWFRNESPEHAETLLTNGLRLDMATLFQSMSAQMPYATAASQITYTTDLKTKARRIRLIMGLSEAAQAANNPDGEPLQEAAPVVTVRAPRPSVIGSTPYSNQLHIARQVSAAVHADLVSGDDHSADLRAGRLIVLGITRLLLLDLACLRAFVRCLLHPIRASDAWWHLELQLTTGSGDNLQLRRVFLDTAVGTAVMVDGSAIRASDKAVFSTHAIESDRVLNQRIHTLAGRYLSAIGLSTVLSCEGAIASRLVKIQSAWSTLQLPPMVHAYATRSLDSRSIPESNWRRLLGLAPNEQHDDAQDDQDAEALDIDDDNDRDEDDEIVVFADIRVVALKSCLSKNLKDKPAAKRAVRAWQSESGDEESDALRLLGQWVEHTLEQGLKSGKSAAVSTILLMLRLVSGPWIAMVGPRVLKACSANELMGVFDDVLDSFSTVGTRQRAQGSLREFVHYLQTVGEIPASVASGFKTSGGQSFVSAHLISPSEAQSIGERLRSARSGIVEPGRRALTNWLVDGAYYLSMRRNEVLHLRIGDLHVNDGTGDILVRPTKDRRLKSSASQRKLPMSLLPADSRLRLCSAVTGQPAATQLAQVIANQDSRIDEWQLLPLVNLAIQTTLQSTTPHFHHLRHCAASWTLLQLMADALDLHRYTQRCPLIADVLAGSETTRTVLLGHTELSRQAWWATSALLGHAFPETTMRSYIHVMDLLLFACIDTDDKRGASSEVAGLTGVPLKTVRRWFERKPVTYRLQKIESRVPGGAARDDSALEFTDSLSKHPQSVVSTELMDHLSDVYVQLDEARMADSVPGHLAEAAMIADEIYGIKTKSRRSNVPVIRHSTDGNFPLVSPLVGRRQLMNAAEFAGGLEVALTRNPATGQRAIGVWLRGLHRTKGFATLPSSDQDLDDLLMLWRDANWENAMEFHRHDGDAFPTMDEISELEPSDRSNVWFRWNAPDGKRTERHASAWALAMSHLALCAPCEELVSFDPDQ